MKSPALVIPVLLAASLLPVRAEAVEARIASVSGGALVGSVIVPSGVDPGPGQPWPFAMGETFTVDVVLDMHGESLMHSWSTSIAFDPAVLQVASTEQATTIHPNYEVTPGSLCTASTCFGGTGYLPVAGAEAPGVWRLGDWGLQPGTTGNYADLSPQIIARVTFEVVGAEALGTPLSLTLNGTTVLQSAGPTAQPNEATLLFENDVTLGSYEVGRVPEPEAALQIVFGALTLGCLGATRRRARRGIR